MAAWSGRAPGGSDFTTNGLISPATLESVRPWESAGEGEEQSGWGTNLIPPPARTLIQSPSFLPPFPHLSFLFPPSASVSATPRFGLMLCLRILKEAA